MPSPIEPELDLSAVPGAESPDTEALDTEAPVTSVPASPVIGSGTAPASDPAEDPKADSVSDITSAPVGADVSGDVTGEEPADEQRDLFSTAGDAARVGGGESGKSRSSLDPDKGSGPSERSPLEANSGLVGDPKGYKRRATRRTGDGASSRLGADPRQTDERPLLGQVMVEQVGDPARLWELNPAELARAEAIGQKPEARPEPSRLHRALGKVLSPRLVAGSTLAIIVGLGGIGMWQKDAILGTRASEPKTAPLAGLGNGGRGDNGAVPVRGGDGFDQVMQLAKSSRTILGRSVGTESREYQVGAIMAQRTMMRTLFAIASDPGLKLGAVAAETEWLHQRNSATVSDYTALLERIQSIPGAREDRRTLAVTAGIYQRLSALTNARDAALSRRFAERADHAMHHARIGKRTVSDKWDRDLADQVAGALARSMVPPPSLAGMAADARRGYVAAVSEAAGTLEIIRGLTLPESGRTPSR